MPDPVYLIANQEGQFPVPGDWVQSWHHSGSLARARSECMSVHWFLGLERPLQVRGLEVLRLLSRFTFATQAQLERALALAGHRPGDLGQLLELFLDNRALNAFTLSLFPLEQLPPDALRIFCLDVSGAGILVHYHREDFVFWQAADSRRCPDQVLRRLGVLDFFLALQAGRGRQLRWFEPSLTVCAGPRDARFSAGFALDTGSGARSFLLEAVRAGDLPCWWRRKVAEQIVPFLKGGHWRRFTPAQPVFLLLAEDLDTAREAADLFARGTGMLRFRVTTDREVARGPEEARFFRYVPGEEGSGEGTLVPVPFGLFTPGQTGGEEGGEPHG